MEITNNQIQTVKLEGMTTPAKVFAAKAAEVEKPQPEMNAVIAPKEPEKEDGSQKKVQNLHIAVSQINDYVQSLQRNLKFTVDEVTGKDIVTIIDSESKEVIRQLPSEEALELARRLAESRENGVQIVNSQV